MTSAEYSPKGGAKQRDIPVRTRASDRAEYAAEGDVEQLQALGYATSFERSMSLWANFSLGFTYLSPVVGVYTLFTYALATAGPPMFWSYLLVGIGQFLVCLVFAEVVSQYPIAGGVYPWARRLIGKKWAWMVAWIYIWALCATIAGVAIGAGPYLGALLGFEASTEMSTFVGIVLVVITTALNLGGTKLLSRVALLGFLAELGGALVVGAYLLLFERHQPISVLFDTFEIGTTTSYWPAFLAGALAGIFQYYGFEACGDLAEEVPNPSRRIPKAMRMTIYIGGAAAMFVCVALILAVPDINKVIAGEDTDAVGTLLTTAFGPVGSKLVLAVVMISFVSCLLSLQAAASRLLFSFARDKMIFASSALQSLSTSRIPYVALIVCGIIPAVMTLVGLGVADALTLVVSFAAIGIYLAFQMIVLGALIARLRGWRPSGQFTLGAWGPIVTVLALAYGVSAIVNMAWPRTPDAPWYINYSMVVMTIGVLASGLLYLWLFKPHERSLAPSGDAARSSVTA